MARLEPILRIDKIILRLGRPVTFILIAIDGASE